MSLWLLLLGLGVFALVVFANAASAKLRRKMIPQEREAYDAEWAEERNVW